jgi:hypothetical protein
MGGAARPDHAVASNPSSSRQLAVGFGASLHEVVENAKIQPQAGDGPPSIRLSLSSVRSPNLPASISASNAIRINLRLISLSQ